MANLLKTIILILFLSHDVTNLHAQSKDQALFFVVTDFDYWTDFGKNSERQVREIEKELQSNYGFQTEFIVNPTRQQILKTLQNYGEARYDSDDQLLIYFSMHGHFEEGGTGALIPKDGKRSDYLYETWIPHTLLEDFINRIKCEHIVLSLDACYSGTFGGDRGKPSAPAWEANEDCTSKKKNALLHKSRLYLTSGGKERTPIKSQFAEKWLEALRLRNDDGVLGFHDLYGVLSDADPRPRFGDFRDHVKGGDFVFVHRSTCAAAPKITDANHWQEVKSNQSRESFLEHLREFPGCPHEEEAIGFLTPVSSRPNEVIPIPQEKKAEPNKEKNTLPPNGMVFVKGGSFQMGSNEGAEDEKPIHKVTLGDFFMSIHEVTFNEYDQFCQATGQEKPDDEGWGRDARPAINVSWHDAVAYANWLSEQDNLQKVYTINKEKVTANWNANGYRLPTEAEWEYAARSRGKEEKWAGTSNEKYLATYGNFCDKNCSESWADKNADDGHINTAPVGSFSANDLGLKDMSGNVYEWCWDWKDTYPSPAQIDPKGPSSGSNRVIRGGSWHELPSNLRCASRISYGPDLRLYNIGFRLSRAAF